MADKNQEIDASGVSVATMTREEIDAALSDFAGMTADKPEVAVADSPDSAVSPEPTEQTAIPPAEESPPNPGPASAEHSPLEEAAVSPETPPPDQTEVSAQTSPALDADAEAALNRIDQDLAELESLLADTTADGTSPTAARLAATAEPAATEQPAAVQETEADKAADATADSEEADEDADADLLEETAACEADQEFSASAATETLEEPVAQPSQEAAASNAGPARPQAAPAPEVSPQTFQDQLISAAASLLLMPLKIIDAPFAGLNLRIKTVLGLVGIATLMVAAATWILGILR